MFDCTESTQFPSLLCLYKFQVDLRFIHLFLSKGQHLIYESFFLIHWYRSTDGLTFSHFHFYIFTMCAAQSQKKNSIYTLIHSIFGNKSHFSCRTRNNRRLRKKQHCQHSFEKQKKKKTQIQFLLVELNESKRHQMVH